MIKMIYPCVSIFLLFYVRKQKRIPDNFVEYFRILSTCIQLYICIFEQLQTRVLFIFRSIKPILEKINGMILEILCTMNEKNWQIREKNCGSKRQPFD